MRARDVAQWVKMLARFDPHHHIKLVYGSHLLAQCLRGKSQEDLEFKVILGYLASSKLAQETLKKKKVRG